MNIFFLLGGRRGVGDGGEEEEGGGEGGRRDEGIGNRGLGWERGGRGVMERLSRSLFQLLNACRTSVENCALRCRISALRGTRDGSKSAVVKEEKKKGKGKKTERKKTGGRK